MPKAAEVATTVTSKRQISHLSAAVRGRHNALGWRGLVLDYAPPPKIPPTR